MGNQTQGCCVGQVHRNRLPLECMEPLSALNSEWLARRFPPPHVLNRQSPAAYVSIQAHATTAPMVGN
jgi:hypothetical protein